MGILKSSLASLPLSPGDSRMDFQTRAQAQQYYAEEVFALTCRTQLFNTIFLLKSSHFDRRHRYCTPFCSFGLIFASFASFRLHVRRLLGKRKSRRLVYECIRPRMPRIGQTQQVTQLAEKTRPHMGRKGAKRRRKRAIEEAVEEAVEAAALLSAGGAV